MPPISMPERAAAELVVDEELDLAGLLAGRPEGPAVLHVAERPLQIFDQDLQLRPVERDAAAKALAHQLERHRHVGDDDLDALARRRCAGAPSGRLHSGTNSG